MKILKTKKLFTYMVVGALVMALSISCKSNEEPQETGSTSSNHPSQGTYTNSSYNTRATVTINNDGTCTITGTAYFDANDSQTFSITVTKWWYYYRDVDSGRSIYYAGSNYEQSEATINLPVSDYFKVEYQSDIEIISVEFGPEENRYWTGYLGN